MYRVAICLHGLIGSISGRSHETTKGARDVLKYADKSWHEFIVEPQENTQVDFFTHSWSTELDEEINTVFKPKGHFTEPVREFKIPDHVTEITCPEKYPGRAQAHYHRWFSLKQSVLYKKQYEEKNNFTYDCVMCSRYDLSWRKTIKFKEHDQNMFWVTRWQGTLGKRKFKYGKPPTAKKLKSLGLKRWKKPKADPTKKLKDFWFFSNSKNMDNFSTLYDNLFKYTKLKHTCGPFGISSHYLAPHHMNMLNLEPKEVLSCHDNEVNTDCPLIRCVILDNNS